MTALAQITSHRDSSDVRSGGMLLQRKCACGQQASSAGACTKCMTRDKLQISASSVNYRDTAPPIVHEVLRSPGRPLDAATRAFMEPRFGSDFGNVRVHADAMAAESATGVGALAYTVGHHIAFGADQYSPHSPPGRRLLAHELTHTLQQRDSWKSSRGGIEIGPASSAHEHEADRVANHLTSDTTHTQPQSRVATPMLQRQLDLDDSAEVRDCEPGRTSPAFVVSIVFFAKDDATLTSAQQAIIAAALLLWRGRVDRPVIRIDGYASTEGTEEHNQDLSCRRAQSVAAELVHPTIASTGVPAGLITMQAHGETDQFSAAFEANRRVSISIATAPAPEAEVTPEKTPREPINLRQGQQLKCVIDKGGCFDLPAGVPTEEQVRKGIEEYNKECRKETNYAGPDVSPTDEDCRSTPEDNLVYRIEYSRHPAWAPVDPTYLIFKSGEPFELPHFVKVQEVDNKGLVNVVILEGRYKDKDAWINRGFLAPESAPDATAKVKFDQTAEQLWYGGIGPVDSTADHTNPIPLGTHDLEIPDFHHSLGDSYGDYATTWFRVGHSGDRYLHPGRVSLGCATIEDTDHWPSIWAYLIKARKDSRSVGEIEVV